MRGLHRGIGDAGSASGLIDVYRSSFTLCLACLQAHPVRGLHHGSGDAGSASGRTDVQGSSIEGSPVGIFAATKVSLNNEVKVIKQTHLCSVCAAREKDSVNFWVFAFCCSL